MNVRRPGNRINCALVIAMCVLGIGGLAACRDQSPEPSEVVGQLFVRTGYLSDIYGEALGEFGEEAVPILINALTSEDLEAKKTAMRALGDIGPDAAAAVPQLAKLLHDEQTRRPAARALGEIGPGAINAIEDLIEAFSYEDRNASLLPLSAAAAKLGPEAIPSLLEALEEDDDWGVRRHAVRALGNMRPCPEQAIRALSKAAVQDEEPIVRRDAVFFIGHIGPWAVSGVPFVTSALKDSDEAVRSEAIDAMGRLAPLGGKEAADVLMEILRAELNKDGAYHAVSETLSHMGRHGSQVVPTLLEMLPSGTRRSVPYPYYVLEALVNLGPHGAEAFEMLLTQLDHDRWDVRAAAATALGNMGPMAEPAVEDILPLLNDEESERVRICAALALGRIGRPLHLILPALGKMAESDYPDDFSADVPAAALAALAAMGPDAAEQAPVVRRIMRNNEELRIQAAHTLLSISPNDAEAMAHLLANTHREAFVRGVDQQAGALMALGLLGLRADYIDRAVVRSMDSDYPPNRIWAAFAWQRTHPESERGLDILRQAMRSTDSRQHAMAGKAIAWLGEGAEPMLEDLLLAISRDRSGSAYDFEASCLLGTLFGKDAFLEAWRVVHRALEGETLPADTPMFYRMDSLSYKR